MLKQEFQDLERLVLKADPGAISAQLTQTQISLKIRESQNLGSARTMGGVSHTKPPPEIGRSVASLPGFLNLNDFKGYGQAIDNKAFRMLDERSSSKIN